MLNTRRDGVVYPVKSIVRDGTYRWRGVVHEGLYPVGPEGRVGHVEGDYYIESRRAGARSKDPTTYYRDATVLVSALADLAPEDEDLRARYTFYCANSWRDANVPREAVYWYRQRIALKGWADEVYQSWLGLGIELIKAGETDQAILAFLSGQDCCPERAECLYQLARNLRLQGRPASALIFAQEGLSKPVPDPSRLFVWHSVYEFWMVFEYLMCLKDLGRLAEGQQAMARLRASAAPRYLLDLVVQ